MKKSIFDAKIEEIADGFIVVMIAAMTHNSPFLKEDYKKDQDSLDIIGSLSLNKRTILRKKFLKEVKIISKGIAEEIDELATVSKH